RSGKRARGDKVGRVYDRWFLVLAARRGGLRGLDQRRSRRRGRRRLFALCLRDLVWFGRGCLSATRQQKSREQDGQQTRRALHTFGLEIHFPLGLLLLVAAL